MNDRPTGLLTKLLTKVGQSFTRISLNISGLSSHRRCRLLPFIAKVDYFQGKRAALIMRNIKGLLYSINYCTKCFECFYSIS